MSLKFMLLAGASTALLATPVFAQTPPPAVEDAGEIVVTAQKRSENVQDVPVSVSVVSAEALATSGGSQLSDLPKLATGLTITSGDQPGNNQIFLRGVGTFAFSIGVEPSVLTVVDDIAVGLQAQAFGDLADVERVEVLRGPQSTLFGKAASAGAILVTTKAPSSKFTANAEVMLNDNHEQRYQLGVSGPLGESGFSFRASAVLGRYDGNVRNLTTGHLINGSNSDAFRFKLRFEPNNSFDATLSAYYVKSQQDCCASVVLDVPAGSSLFNIPQLGLAGIPAATVFAGITPGIKNHLTRLDVEPTADVKDYGASLKFNVALGEHTFTSITGLSKYSLTDRTDFDGSDLDIFAYVAPAANPLQHGSLTQSGEFIAKTFSQEVRIASPKGRFEYLVGGYFAGNDFTRRFRRDASRIQTRSFEGTTSSDSSALFFNGNFSIVDGTRLIGGLRYNHETIRYTFNNLISGATFPRDSALPGVSSDSVLVGKGGIQQDFGRDVMVFATYSKGYKGAAYDLTSGFNAAIALTQPIKPETVNSYEVGIKAEFLDRRVRLNLTGFFSEFSNYQQQTIAPGLGASFTLANVGKVRTKGIELDWSVKATDWLRLSGGLAYTDATIVSFPQAPCYGGQATATVTTLAAIPAGGCYKYTGVTGIDPATGLNVPNGFAGQNLAGAPLFNAPKWKGNIAADFKLPLGSVEAGLNLNYSFQSGVNYSITQDPVTFQKAYGIFNAALSLAQADQGRYKLTLFARNLFDKAYYANLGNARGNFGQNVQTGLLPRDFDRTLGVRLSLKY
jgi:iron complex outermembrane recepter protein